MNKAAPWAKEFMRQRLPLVYFAQERSRLTQELIRHAIDFTTAQIVHASPLIRIPLQPVVRFGLNVKFEPAGYEALTVIKCAANGITKSFPLR
jgi:hypothetical protein